jgi:hypothetical protein
MKTLQKLQLWVSKTKVPGAKRELDLGRGGVSLVDANVNTIIFLY